MNWVKARGGCAIRATLKAPRERMQADGEPLEIWQISKRARSPIFFD